MKSDREMLDEIYANIYAVNSLGNPALTDESVAGWMMDVLLYTQLKDHLFATRRPTFPFVVSDTVPEGGIQMQLNSRLVGRIINLDKGR